MQFDGGKKRTRSVTGMKIQKNVNTMTRNYALKTLQKL